MHQEQRTLPIEEEERHSVPPPSPNLIVNLLRELRDEMQTLLHQELELVKTEMSEKVDETQSNIKNIVVGAVILTFAALFGLWTLNFGLNSLYVELGMPLEHAVWTAPLTLAVILAIIGGSVLSRGKSKLRSISPKPEKTIRSMKRNKEWAEDKVRRSS